MLRTMTITLLVLATIMLALPTTIGLLGRRPAESTLPDGADSIPVQVYFPDTKKVEAIPLGDYLKGVVAGEMPPEFEMEAIKAQFIVARTYTVRRMRQFGGQGGCPLNPAADVCADFSTNQAFMNRDTLVARHGKLVAESFWRRLERAQAETSGLVLTHKGVLIDPLYHGVSGKATENAEEYFANPAPYLVSVDDHWGADAPRLVQQTHFSPDAFALALGGEIPPTLAVTTATGAGRSPVQVTARTATGRVKTVKVGELTLTGREFRERLGLPSTDFRVFLQDGKVVVETVGNGHGVGMSQYGANGMARAGKQSTEILTHYYQGVTISRLFES